MADIFLSYASADRARIEALAAALEASGYTVWWDRQILGGSDFSVEIEREIDQAKAVVVAWSQAACASKWVRDEAAFARDRGTLVPVKLDASTPPLGFRQLQTIDFSKWAGERDTQAFTGLLASVSKSTMPKASAQTSQPATAHDSQPAKSFAMPPAMLPLLAVAGAVAAFAVAGVLFATHERAAPPIPPPPKFGTPPIDPALAGLAASQNPQERAAYQSFVGGDQKEALSILERFAHDLEAKGETKAAAEAYTRAGDVGLLIDPGRGLAARQRAFELDPQSISVFQGLFFDMGTYKGWDAAIAFGNQTAAEPKTADKMRAVAYAHVAMLMIDAGRGVPMAEDYLQRVETIRKALNDRELELIESWVRGFVAWRQDKLSDARADSAAAVKLIQKADFAPPLDVLPAMIEYSSGDWAAAFRIGASTLSDRRKKGEFMPWPLFNTTCLSGLFIGEIAAAAPFCEAAADIVDMHGGAWPKYMSAQLAAARGDADEARTELAASRALAPEAPPIEAGRLRVEAQLAAMNGEFDAAQALIWRHLDLLAADPAARSARATALRLFAIWAVEKGETARACAPLTEAKGLYEAIGGAAGARAAADLAAKASCP